MIEDVDGRTPNDVSQSGGGFPSDLADTQRVRLEGLIPPATLGGRPRKTDMRAAMNGLFYPLRTGCPWRYLPGDPLPPRSKVYNIFRKFQRGRGVGADLGGIVHGLARSQRAGGQPSRCCPCSKPISIEISVCSEFP